MSFLEKEIDFLKSEVRATDKKLDRVLFYLENDGRTGSKGLVSEVAEIKKDSVRIEAKIDSFIAEYKKKEAVTTAIKNTKTVFWGALGAVLVWVGEWLIEFLVRRFIH